jgi:hypothetical protein
MTPATPVLKKCVDPDPPLRAYAANQPEYVALPAVVSNDREGCISWRERIIILLRGDLYIQVLTFHQLLQPIKPSVDEPPAEECV